mmetsp:Transcript_32232/g.51336  ORF Transcript_32232/g.51336 Transcript_32232/m.51336 type:complete len:214 (-) Transcript_32232:2755-3396(-)
MSDSESEGDHQDDLGLGYDTGILPARVVSRAEVPELDYSIVPKLHQAARDGQISLVKALLETEQVDVNAHDNAHQTALHYVCGVNWHNKALEITKYLLKHGANVNIKDVLGSTPLHNAVRSNKLDVVEYFLSNAGYYPINLNVSTVDMNTPLHIAVQLNNKPITEMLLKYGAQYNVLNVRNETPLLIAKRNNFHQLVELIIAVQVKLRSTNME